MQPRPRPCSCDGGHDLDARSRPRGPPFDAEPAPRLRPMLHARLSDLAGTRATGGPRSWRWGALTLTAGRTLVWRVFFSLG